MKLEKMKELVCLAIIKFFNLFPIKKNKLFLFSYYGSQYGCNPKYITNYILDHYPKETFDIVWAFNNVENKSVPSQIRKVKIMSLRYFYELCTAKVIITNYRTTNLFIKRKDQYYIQTWHSSLRLKQIEKDAEAALPTHYIQMAKKDSAKCDLLLSGCKYSTTIFERSFWYKGEIFEYGTPRNDLLFQNNLNKRKEIVENLSIPNEANILLYAPTFRKDSSLDVYDLNFKNLQTKLQMKFGGNWIILVKLHPHLISRSNELVYGESVIDVTSYDDIQELLLISHILISDYSSLIFDFSITKRPCFLYVPDLHTYTSEDRQLYFNISDLPFISAVSNTDLLEEIANFQLQSYKYELNRFLKQIGSYEDGQANKHLLEHIHNICLETERGEYNEAV